MPAKKTRAFAGTAKKRSRRTPPAEERQDDVEDENEGTRWRTGVRRTACVRS